MPRFDTAIAQTALYGFSIVIMKGISILMLPFIAHQLEPEAFGKLEVLSSFAVIGSILVGLGLDDTLYRFAGEARDVSERKRIAARVFGLGLLAGGVALGLLWFLAAELTRWLPGDIQIYELRLVLVVLALEGAIAIPMGWLRMQNRAIAFFVLSIARAATQATLILLMLQPGNDITPVLEAGCIAASIQALVLAGMQLRDTGIRLGGPIGSGLIRYSLPIVGSGLIAFLLNGLDRWIIAGHAGLAEVALYGVAAKFALAAVLLLQPFGMWWSPKRFEVIAGPDGDARATATICLGISLCLIICVAVATGAPVLIGWLMPGDYYHSAAFALGLVIAMSLREISELVNIGCYLSRSTIAQFWINLASSLTGLLCMLVLVDDHGAWGVILALILAQSMRLLMLFRASQARHRLDYPLRSLGLLAAQALAWMAFSMHIEEPLQQLLLALVASLAMAASAFLLQLLPLASTNKPVAARPGISQC